MFFFQHDSIIDFNLEEISNGIKRSQSDKVQSQTSKTL
jgi:hypothetical protein